MKLGTFFKMSTVKQENPSKTLSTFFIFIVFNCTKLLVGLLLLLAAQPSASDSATG